MLWESYVDPVGTPQQTCGDLTSILWGLYRAPMGILLETSPTEGNSWSSLGGKSASAIGCRVRRRLPGLQGCDASQSHGCFLAPTKRGSY